MQTCHFPKIITIVVALIVSTSSFFGGLQPTQANSNLEINIFSPEGVGNPSALRDLEQRLELKFTSAKWYLDWSQDFTPEIAQGLSKQNVIPELTWQPQLNGGGCVIYKEVLSGKYDAYLNRFIQSVRNSGVYIRISLAPEMNGQWVPWGIGNCNNSAEDFKLFWQYTVGKFRSQKVEVEWIWAPNIHHYEEIVSFADIFPGDDYIDFMGLDGYNWGTSQEWSAWQSFRDTFESSYNDLLTLSGKDIIITEFASTETGGNKAQWITDMFNDLKTTFPRIIGITWFNINKETDWRINSSLASEEAFKKGAKEFFTIKANPNKEVLSANEESETMGQAKVAVTQDENLTSQTPAPDNQKKYLKTRRPLPLEKTKMVKSASSNQPYFSDSFKKISFTLWIITNILLLTIAILVILILKQLKSKRFHQG